MTEKELEEANQLQKNLFSAKEKIGDIESLMERSKERIDNIGIDFEMTDIARTYDVVINESELKDALGIIHKTRKNALDTAQYHFDNFLK